MISFFIVSIITKWRKSLKNQTCDVIKMREMTLSGKKIPKKRDG